MDDRRYQLAPANAGEIGLADTQPGKGWGFICALCRHTLPDDQKYVAMPPARPCRANIWKVNLRRYADSSESCACFERDIVLQGTRRTGWPEKVGQ